MEYFPRSLDASSGEGVAVIMHLKMLMVLEWDVLQVHIRVFWCLCNFDPRVFPQMHSKEKSVQTHPHPTHRTTHIPVTMPCANNRNHDYTHIRTVLNVKWQWSKERVVCEHSRDFPLGVCVMQCRLSKKHFQPLCISIPLTTGTQSTPPPRLLQPGHSGAKREATSLEHFTPNSCVRLQRRVCVIHQNTNSSQQGGRVHRQWRMKGNSLVCEHGPCP